jgi:hypothetical protein
MINLPVSTLMASSTGIVMLPTNTVLILPPPRSKPAEMFTLLAVSMLLICANKTTVLYPIGGLYTLLEVVVRFAVTVLNTFSAPDMIVPYLVLI